MKGKELLRGHGGSPGVVIATVRIVDDDAAKKAQIQPGEVYVAEFPTPADNPYLKKAAAIVTNRGGRTTHAAIMSREWGIPSVVGTLNATEVLYDGQKVVVDGQAERDEKGRPVGIIYEYVGGEEVSAPPPTKPAPPKPSLADMMAKLAAEKGIKIDPDFIGKMKERE